MGLLSWVGLAVGLLLVVAGCWVAYQLLLQSGRVILRLEALERQLREQGILPDPAPAGSADLPIGTVLNDFALPLLGGGDMTLSQWRGRRLLLIFFNPACSFCRQMLAELAASPPTTPDLDPMPLFLSTGDAGENRRVFEEHRMPYPVLLQEGAEVASFYNVYGTPMGYLVDENGATASTALVGAELLLAALRRPGSLTTAAPQQEVHNGGSRRKFSPSLADSRIVRDGLKAGTQAPGFTLPQLDERELSLQDYRGRRVLLVFSDPECGPCNQLAPKLEQIHRRSGDMQVLMVSRGDRQANARKAAEYGLTFPIARQRHWEISRAYGMFATPIAYLIDQEGILVSNVAVGGEAILNLASGSGVFIERTAEVQV